MQLSAQKDSNIQSQSKYPEANSAPQNTQRIQPAFYDMETGVVYLSKFENGSTAPVHTYDGLPESVLERSAINIISGFVTDGQFVTMPAAKFNQ